MSQHNHLYRPVGEDQCANLSNIELSQSTFEYQVNEPPSTKHTYSSFPSPVSGRSPTLPSFRIPKYGYFGLDGPAGARSPTSSPVEFVHPGSSADVRKNSVFRALIQSINYFMGIGVLTLPYALATTGWFGLVLLVVFGGIMTLTAWLYGGSRRKLYLENFSDHIELAFATRGKVFVSLIFYASMLINAGVFTKLLSDTLSSLTGYSAAPTMVITVLTFILVTNLSTTSTAPLTRIMSVIGTLSTVLLILGLIVAEILALLRYEASLDSVESVYMHVWSYTATERVYITDLKACLQTLGVFGYCYMGHEVFPAIFHHMRHPQYFTFVVSIAFTSMLLCYATIATLGYLVYGVTASGNIIENLPPTDILTVCIKVCIVVTVLAKLTLCAAPLSEGIHEWTRLLCYLSTHWLCPSIRLPSDHTHTVVLPVHTSQYGTYPALSPAHKWVSPYHNKSTLHRLKHTQSLSTLSTPHTIPTLANRSTLSPLTTQELDLNLANDRRQYFNTAYFDVEKEILAQHSFDIEENRLSGLDEASQLLPTLPIGTTDAGVLSPLYHDPSYPSYTNTITPNSSSTTTCNKNISMPPYPPAPLVPSVSTLNLTPPVHSHKGHSHKELSWSEPLLMIPPIRSPPCGRVLSSSADNLVESMHMPHLTLGQALVQQEGELVSEEEQSQSLGHSLSALTELLGSHSSSTRYTADTTNTVYNTKPGKTNTISTSTTTFKPLTLRKPEDCTALAGSTNPNNTNDIHSDSDSSSSLETIDMWYTKEDTLLPVKDTATAQTTAKTATRNVTPLYTSFASPSSHTQLSSFAQYQQQLQEQQQQQQQQQQRDTVAHHNPYQYIPGDCAADRILPVLIRCTIPLIALGLASLFDSFVSMVIFTGGVCGGSVSIVIPTYAYYNIHYREMYTVEKLLLVAVIVVGAAMVLATLIFATF